VRGRRKRRNHTDILMSVIFFFLLFFLFLFLLLFLVGALVLVNFSRHLLFFLPFHLHLLFFFLLCILPVGFINFEFDKAGLE
jgi:hypothetical protein